MAQLPPKRNLKFPYGETNFHDLITDGCVYQDRTHYIRQLEETGKNLLLLRPRRFGKSLFLSTLESYYDLAKADQFERLFGHLEIGQDPTPLHNHYFILKWDFSMVNPRGDVAAIEQSLFNTINIAIQKFILTYQPLLQHSIKIFDTDGLASFQSLLAVTEAAGHPVYLLVDEYDNFANEVMVSRERGQKRYEELIQGEGLLKTLFKVLKGMLAGAGLGRIFMTGVSPVVMSDLTSGQFVARNIYFKAAFNDLCGFTEDEVQQMLQQVAEACGFSAAQTDTALGMMKRYYNGYQFVFPPDEGQIMYNPTMVLYFLEHLQESCRYPREMLDSNLSPDRKKLAYVASIPGGAQVVVKAVDEQQPLTVQKVAGRFGVQEMLDAEDDNQLIISLLYYLGMLTWDGSVDTFGDLSMRIPNMTIRGLYYERLQKIILPSVTPNQLEQASRPFYTAADLQPVCELVEARFNVLDNRDYRMADELLVKAMFLSLLFNNIVYLIDSERSLQRGYADLTMIVRPDMRQFKLLDHVVEFKFVTLKEAGLGGAEVRERTTEQLWQLDAVQASLSQAKKQLSRYRTGLAQIYPDELRLHEHVVIAIGFERLLWAEVTPSD